MGRENLKICEKKAEGLFDPHHALLYHSQFFILILNANLYSAHLSASCLLGVKSALLAYSHAFPSPLAMSQSLPHTSATSPRAPFQYVQARSELLNHGRTLHSVHNSASALSWIQAHYQAYVRVCLSFFSVR